MLKLLLREHSETFIRINKLIATLKKKLLRKSKFEKSFKPIISS